MIKTNKKNNNIIYFTVMTYDICFLVFTPWNLEDLTRQTEDDNIDDVIHRDTQHGTNHIHTNTTMRF